MRGGQADEEANNLYTEAITVHNDELCPMATKFEAAVLELVQAKSRQSGSSNQAQPPNLGKLKTMHNIEPLISDLKDILVKVDSLLAKFAELCQSEKNVKKTLFYRTRHAMTHVEKMKVNIQQLLRRFVDALLQLVSGRNVATVEGGAASDWQYALECVDAFNKIIDGDKSLATSVTEAAKANSVLHMNARQVKHVDENFNPSYQILLRQISSSQVLQVLANERSWIAASEVTRSLVVGLERRLLLTATEECTWLGVPLSTLDNNAAGVPSPTESVSLYPVVKKLGSAGSGGSVKNKDGNGNKRKNRRASEVLASADVRLGLHERSHFSSIEDFVAHEEVYLNGLFTVLSQVSGLLAKSVLKPSKSGSGDRISKTVKQRMAEYYHDVLWQNVGELVQQTVLWFDLPGYVHLPFALQHPRVCLGLSNVIQDNLYNQLTEGYPPLVFPTMQLLVEALNLHVISTSWDLQYLTCLAEASRSKLRPIEVNNMISGTTVTKPGKLFYDTLKIMARLNNRCHPDELRDFVEHGSHDAEEFPFLEEQHILRRIESTLFSLRNWSVSRSKSALHNWHIRDFVLITQGDLLNSQDCYKLVQLATHEKLLNAKGISVQLFTHIQSFLTKEIKECQQNLTALPDRNLQDLSKVCRTFSLATLKNIFPSSSHWNKSNHSQPQTSPYVQGYIDRVLAPVVDALVPMRVETQQNVARITLKTFCEAWLEHIRNRRIKFSEHGAQQISVDFTYLRTWINNNETLKEESRRYLLLLDSIRQCEGVARLLQAKPGEIVDIKPPSKNKVAPITDEKSANRTQSPVHQILESLPAELYVPNQQQWISLKGGSKLALPFCCR